MQHTHAAALHELSEELKSQKATKEELEHRLEDSENLSTTKCDVLQRSLQTAEEEVDEMDRLIGQVQQVLMSHQQVTCCRLSHTWLNCVFR